VYCEIGSIFWYVETKAGNYNMIENGYDSCYLLSGRTSLDYIIKDIKDKHEFNTVYMPSYCCRSMIEPFLKYNIEVVFYDVVVDKKNGYRYNIDINTKCDAILVMQYFGFRCEEIENIVDLYKKKGKIVIEDATHSIFSENPYSRLSDYIYASLRKWSGFAAGAVALKTGSNFTANKTMVVNEDYINTNKQIMMMKKQYIEEEKSIKEDFMRRYKLCEEALYKDYQAFTITDELMNIIRELDLEKIKKQRNRNASQLIGALSGNKTVRSIYKFISDGDCPFYVPIYIAKDKRDKLKSFLSSKQIYCPSHWYFSAHHNVSKDAISLYENSLSLVCDQRYGSDDMKKIADAVDEFSAQQC
jgi:dTDP-4-amino-4,6-dideoxygalactose transaminase